MRLIRDKISAAMRARRAALLRELIDSCSPRRERLSILDIGGKSGYWRNVGYDFLLEQRVHITLANYHESELAASPGEPEGLFSRIVADGCNLRLPDRHFDLCHSNSVIEHVGDWRKMQAFASEMMRVASAIYCQTPNFDFPIDPHFPSVPLIHRMPLGVRARLVTWFPIPYGGRADDLTTGYKVADSSRMLKRHQMVALFPGLQIVDEKVFGLTKSFIAIRT
ncbi:MAG: class I SAM-dependent methyltransferase [Novosphingobium sp.]